MPISQRAVNLIVACEVTGQDYFTRHYQHPEWPGGASGVTWGIGYDAGYASADKLTADWRQRVPAAVFTAMLKCQGVHGDAARVLLPSVRDDIIVPWPVAMDEFSNVEVPQWTQRVIAAIPAAANLPPDCLGAITSIAYNRGASFTLAGDRYAEMRDIRDHIMAGNLRAVPDDIRAMKRLWPNVKGLRDRRDDEANLFQLGLAASAPSIGVSPVSPHPDDPHDRIRALQKQLTDDGFDTNGIDGRLGPNTVAAFQRAHGLDADGIEGPQTRPALEHALAEIAPLAAAA